MGKGSVRRGGRRRRRAEREGGTQRDGEREREGVCVCMCVCVRGTFNERARWTDRLTENARMEAQIWPALHSNKDTHTHTNTHTLKHARTHTHTREPRLMVLAQVKHHRGWRNVKQQRGEASYSVFLIMQRRVTLQHCISRYDTSWLVSPCRVRHRPHTQTHTHMHTHTHIRLTHTHTHHTHRCISFGMMKQKTQRLKNRLWVEPIKQCSTDGKHIVV